MDNKARPGTAHRVVLFLREYTPAIVFKWTFCWLSPLTSRGTQKKIGREGCGCVWMRVCACLHVCVCGLLRWDWGGLKRRRELPLSLGETGMPTVRRSADTGIRSFKNPTQPLHTNCSSPPAAPPPPPPFSFYALIEAGWRKLWDRLTQTQATSKVLKR